jgi:hypothetical protein
MAVCLGASACLRAAIVSRTARIAVARAGPNHFAYVDGAAGRVARPPTRDGFITFAQWFQLARGAETAPMDRWNVRYYLLLAAPTLPPLRDHWLAERARATLVAAKRALARRVGWSHALHVEPSFFFDELPFFDPSPLLQPTAAAEAATAAASAGDDGDGGDDDDDDGDDARRLFFKGPIDELWADPRWERGVRCRFGARGIVTEAHWDGAYVSF